MVDGGRPIIQGQIRDTQGKDGMCCPGPDKKLRQLRHRVLVYRLPECP